MLTLDVSLRPSHTATARLSPWSSRRWCDYFHRQRAVLLAIPWEHGIDLSPMELAIVAPSLREFQQGEGLEGRHFFCCVRAYAEHSGDHDYAEAHRLFMAEEQRHAQDLAHFLTLAGIPLLTERSSFNFLFCWLGSRGGIELTLAIIAQVEVIAQVYYAALRRATGSELLRRLCTQILRDREATCPLPDRAPGDFAAWSPGPVARADACPGHAAVNRCHAHLLVWAPARPSCRRTRPREFLARRMVRVPHRGQAEGSPELPFNLMRSRRPRPRRR